MSPRNAVPSVTTSPEVVTRSKKVEFRFDLRELELTHGEQEAAKRALERKPICMRVHYVNLKNGILHITTDIRTGQRDRSTRVHDLLKRLVPAMNAEIRQFHAQQQRQNRAPAYRRQGHRPAAATS